MPNVWHMQNLWQICPSGWGFTFALAAQERGLVEERKNNKQETGKDRIRKDKKFGQSTKETIERGRPGKR